MKTTRIIDTTIMLNFLAVPGGDQHRTAVQKEMERHSRASATTLVLPAAVIIETSNAIARDAAGKLRRQLAQKLHRCLQDGLDGLAPWLVAALDMDGLASLSARLVDDATREVGGGDGSIIDLYERMRRTNLYGRTVIWSLDKHLAGYDTHPTLDT